MFGLGDRIFIWGNMALPGGQRGKLAMGQAAYSKQNVEKAVFLAQR